MKFCAIQSPYPYTLEQADAAVDFAVQALKQCDPSIDLILLPEYSMRLRFSRRGNASLCGETYEAPD